MILSCKQVVRESAALDFNTAVWETKPEVGDYITLSEWKIKDGEKLYNHYTVTHPTLL